MHWAYYFDQNIGFYVCKTHKHLCFIAEDQEEEEEIIDPVTPPSVNGLITPNIIRDDDCRSRISDVTSGDENEKDDKVY